MNNTCKFSENGDNQCSSTLSNDKIFKISKMAVDLKHRIAARKSYSPSIVAFLGNTKIIPIIDEGAELTVINAALVQQLCLPVVSSYHSASAAGSNPLSITGQTCDDITITTLFGNKSVPLHLGKVVVVPNLGCDMLLGEPAKQDNKLVTIPHLKQIPIVFNDELLQKPYLTMHEKNLHNYRICRVPTTTCLQPNDSIDVEVSEPNREYQVNHRTEMECWFDPVIVKSNSSAIISLRNNTTLPEQCETACKKLTTLAVLTGFFFFFFLGGGVPATLPGYGGMSPEKCETPSKKWGT